ncbi:hypothetical protein ACIGT4_22155 [Streptomyces sioyaensis]|uniref:hypothetical protein n=1 Tax=Streptomyces sioyaensis TaxID=67364 RepID=UPI0037D4FE16
MDEGARLHASTRRGEPPSVDGVTGEIRIPLALYAVDEYRGSVDLVLSRADGASLLASLVEALGTSAHASRPQRPEDAR